MTHLAPLVQRLYGERVGSYVNDGAQLEPVGGVGRPHWPPILHGSPVVSTTSQLGQKKTDVWHREYRRDQMQIEDHSFACKVRS